MPRARKPRNLDPWPQRDRFIELVDAKAATGVSLAEIASALGLTTTSSLETAYRYDHRRIPKRTTLQRAAYYFGVPLSELYGEPVDDDFGNMMGVLGKNLTPEMRAAMIEMAKSGQIQGAKLEAHGNIAKLEAQAKK